MVAILFEDIYIIFLWTNATDSSPAAGLLVTFMTGRGPVTRKLKTSPPGTSAAEKLVPPEHPRQNQYFVDVLKSDGCRTAKGGALLKEHTLTAINRLY